MMGVDIKVEPRSPPSLLVHGDADTNDQGPVDETLEGSSSDALKEIADCQPGNLRITTRNIHN